MRVLIVSGFPDTPAGQRKHSHWVHSIENYLRKLKALDLRIRVRKQNDLSDFLPQTSCSEEENRIRVRTFDRLDMIFIDGDAKRLPWGAWSSSVFALVRMCFQTGKCLFAASFGMRVLLHVAATNAQRVKVLNGSGKGGPLSELENIDTDDPDIESKVFLDNTTGDAYKFSIKDGTWNPEVNVGFVKRVARKDKGTQRHLDKDTRVHKALYQAPKGYHELTLHVQKIYIQHWLFSGLAEKSFNIKYTCEWDARPIHDRISPDGGACLNVLAVEPVTAAPGVIEYGHIIGVACSVEKEYPEIGKLLENYIKQKHDLIVKHDRLEYMTQEQFQDCLAAESFVNVLDPERQLARQPAHIVPPIKTHELRISVAEVAPASTTDRLEHHERPTPATRHSRRRRSDFAPRSPRASLRAPVPKERVTARAALHKESLAMTNRTASKDAELMDGGGRAAQDFMRMLSSQKKETAAETAQNNVPRKRPTSAVPLSTARGAMTARTHTDPTRLQWTQRSSTPAGFTDASNTTPAQQRRPATATGTRSKGSPVVPIMQTMSLREAFAAVPSTPQQDKDLPSYMRTTASSRAHTTPSPTHSATSYDDTSRSPSPLAWSQAAVRRQLNKGRAALDRPPRELDTKRVIKMVEDPQSASTRRLLKKIEKRKDKLAKSDVKVKNTVWQSQEEREREERILSRALQLGPAWVNPGKATEIQRFNETTAYTKVKPNVDGPYEPPATHNFRGNNDKSKFIDPKGFIVCGPPRTATFDSMR